MTEKTVMEVASPTKNKDDEILAQRVYRALTDIKPLCNLGSPLHIQVKEGVVTLRGVVATHSCKTQLVDVVRAIPGVHEVCEELWA